MNHDARKKTEQKRIDDRQYSDAVMTAKKIIRSEDLVKEGTDVLKNALKNIGYPNWEAELFTKRMHESERNARKKQQ